MFNYYEFKDGDSITSLELLKPDSTSLGELYNASNKVTKISLGEVSELSFTLPHVQDIFNQLEDEEITGFAGLSDDDISKSSITLVGYKIKAIYSNGLEIIYVLPKKVLSSDMKTSDISFTCYSREYELSKKLIIDYQGVLIDGEYYLDGLSLEEVILDLLGGTYWEIGFLDDRYNSSDTNVMRRTVDAFNNVSLLSCIDSVCSVFGAIPVYDTINMTISFYRADNDTYFKYNGLLIDDQNYLKSIDQNNTTDELITRLYGYGSDELTINGVNPIGTSYIEDLSYFLYPAELNETEDALIVSSKYMSDSLALAELLYEIKVNTQTISFEDLYDEQYVLESELIVLENALTVLDSELSIIQDEIDVLYVGTNTATEDNASYVAKRDELDSKQAEIDAKQAEIDAKQAEIDAIIVQINEIYDDIKIDNNFTEDQLKERQCFIYEGLYTNTGIAIEQDLYDEMSEYIAAKREPSIVIDAEIANILAMKSKNQAHDADKIVIGEKVDIYYKKNGLDIDIQAQILSITISEKNNSTSMEITIANTQDYKKDSSTYLTDILKRSITTSTVVTNNIIDWNKGKLAVDELDDLYTQGLDAAQIQIEAASENTVIINNRGLTITDSTEPLRFMRATNGVIALTKDGGRTYSTAITPDGVWAERLIGQVILGNELEIIGGDSDELTISNIASGTYNDVDSEGSSYGDDFGIVMNSFDNRIFITKERGFKITNLSNTNLFYADTSGNLSITGKINATSGTIGGWTINSNSLSGSGTISGGTISGSTISGGSITIGSNFSVNTSGILTAVGGTFSGSIAANSGTIGGLTITSTKLYMSDTGISSNTSEYAIWAGETNGAHGTSSTNAKFRVGHDGGLQTSAISATGGTVGGCTIDSGGIYSGSGTTIAGVGVYGSRYAFWAGATQDDTGSAPFRVGHEGYLVASNATITGTITSSTISGGSISITRSPYYFNMGLSTSNPNCSGLNVGNYGIKAYSDITATGFAITDSDTGKSGTFILRHANGTNVVYLTFTGGILTAYDIV